jgi:hypothetical protein
MNRNIKNYLKLINLKLMLNLTRKVKLGKKLLKDLGQKNIR